MRQELFTTRLAKQLNEGELDKTVEVINAGIVGYGTTNELAYFEHEGHKYEPDIVLLMFFAGNDVLDNVMPAHHKIENGELVPIEFSYDPNIGTPPWAQDGTTFRQIRNYLYTHSRLYSVVLELMTFSLLQQSPQLLDLLQSWGFIEATRPVMNMGNIYSFLQPPDEAWQMTEALIMELDRQIQAQGGQLVVTIIPDETEVDVQKWQNLVQTYPDLFDGSTTENKPTDRLAQFLAQQAVPHIQLRSTFEEYQQKNEEPLYYPYDGHWKPSAHLLATQAIYTYLVDECRWQICE